MFVNFFGLVQMFAFCDYLVVCLDVCNDLFLWLFIDLTFGKEDQGSSAGLRVVPDSTSSGREIERGGGAVLAVCYIAFFWNLFITYA